MGLKERLALDVVQFALDLVGIVEPTGAADGLSALISLGRGKWLDAGISGLSLLPYVGDLAKVGKLPKYLKSVREAIQLAAKDVGFEAKLVPALRRLKVTALDKLPLDTLPAPARASLAELRVESTARH